MASLDTQAIASIQFLQRQAASLLLYQGVIQDEPAQAFLDLLQVLRHRDGNKLSYLECYGRWFKALAAKRCSWEDYLLRQILRDDNPFTQQIQCRSLETLPPALIAAVKHDLQALQSLYECSGTQLSCWVQEAAQLPLAPVAWYQEADKSNTFSDRETVIFESLQQIENWADALADLATYYQQHGTGVFAEYHAFRWQSGQFVGVAYPDSIQLINLFSYANQQEILVKNTEFLLAGYPALHVLLYGSRGSGKSSLVKALLNKYAEQNLRLIEVAKSELKDLPVIVEQLRGVPQKFIIFVDDLSFEEDDDAFKALKVVLEGNITARPDNMVVYATSNRRHLIREYFSDRPRLSDADEINNWDTVQEKLSFSDRFGLTLTFEPADQNTYLNIVRHLADQSGINLPLEELEARALQWATRHNGRSGRSARQFIDFLRSELALSPKT